MVFKPFQIHPCTYQSLLKPVLLIIIFFTFIGKAHNIYAGGWEARDSYLFKTLQSCFFNFKTDIHKSFLNLKLNVYTLVLALKTDIGNIGFTPETMFGNSISAQVERKG